jgi:hypothetical protein
MWGKLLNTMGDFFDRRFGANWKIKDEYLKGFIDGLKKELQT